jgi:CheY-like chemotaxis protein
LARDLIQRQLVREGFAVASAKSGPEGIELARQIRPLFITLDVMMPGMDGWGVLTRLKSDPDLATIPVVMVTMIDDCQLGLTLGAADCLTKPIDRPRLLAIANRFRGESAGRSPILIVGDDSETRHLMAHGLREQGWQVEETANGNAAPTLVSSIHPALILLDLMTPTLSGFAFLSALHDAPDGKSIPVIVVTSQDLNSDDKQRLSGAAQQVLQKGTFTHEQLISVVDYYLHFTSAPPTVVT